MRNRNRATAALTVAFVVAFAPAAGAVHFYRGPGGGCTPATGAIVDGGGEVAATVLMLHNTFNDTANGSPVTFVNAGQAVKWTWNSAHCHSVTSSGAFDSGFHYPTTAPSSPEVAPGLFHYPVPELEPTLSYTRTFPAAGMFVYSCVHHGVIGMNGVVIVS